MIENATKNFYFQRFGNCIGDSRTYMFLQELSGKQQRIPNVRALTSNIGHSMSDSEKVVDVVETFNTFFVNIGLSIQNNTQAPTCEVINEDVEISSFPTPVSYSEVKKNLKSLENKSTSGCDKHTPILVKAIATATVALLAHFSIRSFKNDVSPIIWNVQKYYHFKKVFSKIVSIFIDLFL